MIATKHMEFLNAAIEEAKKSRMNKQHGCVIVSNNTIVGRGHNFRKDDLKELYSIHAEVAAIHNINKQFINNKNLVMYVVRIDKDENLQRSIPCKNCERYILKKNFQKVYYSI